MGGHCINGDTYHLTFSPSLTHPGPFSLLFIWFKTFPYFISIQFLSFKLVLTTVTSLANSCLFLKSASVTYSSRSSSTILTRLGHSYGSYVLFLNSIQYLPFSKTHSLIHSTSVSCNVPHNILMLGVCGNEKAPCPARAFVLAWERQYTNPYFNIQ